MTWLMEQIDARIKNPDKSNLLRHKGRFDLELEVVVEQADRGSISREFLGEMTKEMRERTGLSPIIYLSGDEPETVKNWDPYY